MKRQDGRTMKIEDVFGDLPKIETERLILRKMNLNDAQDLYEYASDAEVTRYVTWDTHKSIEDYRNFLKSVIQRYEKKEVSGWGVVLKENKKFIGTCGYMWWHIGCARAEMGYALSRKYWDKGLMTETVKEIIKFGFEKMKLNRIEARCMIGNIASEKVMEKVGMTFEGIMREQMYAKGVFSDLKMYSILRREY